MFIINNVFTLHYKVLLITEMKERSKSFEDLDTIRTIMEKSTRFLSLSGLGGVFAGLIAIAGAVIAFFLIFKGNFSNDYFSALTADQINLMQKQTITDALLVLITALAVSYFLSYRKAFLKGLRLWTPVSKRLLVSMIVPLASGGMLILILYLQDQFYLIIPSMLIFYGLALVNAGKFTYSEVFYLGLSEIIIGLAAAALPEFGIFLWGLGFGLLHIAYGLLLYRKYEK